MIKRLKTWLKTYDAWCRSLGLTPEQKRCCVAHRSEKSDRSANDVK